MDDTVHKQSKPIPLHRVAVVRPFTRFLEDIGAPVEREFHRAGLPYAALESVDNYIPSHRFWSFLVNMAQAEGIRDLGFLVGRKFGANSADPRMKNMLHESLTLYSGIRELCELVNRTVSHSKMGVLQQPGRGYSYYYHSPSCHADNPAVEQIGWFGLMALIDSVRMFTGPEWQPTRIGVMTKHPPCRSIREAFPDTHIRTSQPYSWIALENTLLAQPPSPPEATTTPSSLTLYESFETGLAGSLEQALLSYMQEGELSIELAAALCNTSKRTLQRNLKESDTSYLKVLDRARFRAASALLGNPAMTVTDIAHRLGYSDVSHFTRAFRRVAGVTPLAYRKQCELKN